MREPIITLPNQSVQVQQESIRAEDLRLTSWRIIHDESGAWGFPPTKVRVHHATMGIAEVLIPIPMNRAGALGYAKTILSVSKFNSLARKCPYRLERVKVLVRRTKRPKLGQKKWICYEKERPNVATLRP